MMKKYTYVFKHYSSLMLSALAFMMLVGIGSANAEINIVPAPPITGAFDVRFPHSGATNGNLDWQWLGGATQGGLFGAVPGSAFEVRQREVGGAFGGVIASIPFVVGQIDYTTNISGLQDGKSYEWEVVLNSANPAYSNSPASFSSPVAISVLTGSISLAKQSVTNNSVTLQLSEYVTGEQEFRLYVCLGGLNACKLTQTFQWNGSQSYGVGFYGNDPLAGNTNYEFYVEAFKNGSTIRSNIEYAKTNRNKPSPPTYALVGTICPYSADLLYNFSNPEQFDYFRILNGATVLATSYTRTSNVTTVSLVPNTAYTLTMEMTNETGSTYQNFNTFVTPAVQGPLGPTSVSGPDALTQTSFGFAWRNSAEDVACNNKMREVYGIEVDVVNRDGTTERLNYSTDKNATYYTITGLKPKSKATVAIRAINYALGANGIGYGSNTITVVTLGPPYAPTDLAGVSGKDALKDIENVLTWKDNADDEDFTIIEIGDGMGGFKFLAQIDKNINRFVHKPVQEGVTYTYRVKSGNKYGDSYFSKEITVTPAYSTEPNAPFNLTAVVGTGMVNLKWKDDSQKESGFVISRSTDAGVTWTKIGEVARNITTYSDKTVTAGTKYWYGVSATNDVGTSDKAVVLVNYVVTQGSARISVYPNPTVDLINLRVENGGNGVISLINQSSRKVLSKTVNFDNGDVSLDMTRFAPGAYQLIIETNGVQESKKIYKN
jgi:hypothetical protein